MNTQNAQQNTDVLNFCKIKVDTKIKFYPTVWKEDLILMKVCDGIAAIYLDGINLTVNNGDVIIVRPFALHSVSPIEDNALTLDVVTINLRTLNSLNFGLRNFNAILPFFHEKNTPYLIKASDYGYEELNQKLNELNNDVDDEKTQENIYYLLKLLYEHRLPAQKHNLSAEKQRFAARKTIEHISCNYASTITIEDLTEVCGYSEFYLMKLFKQYTGISCIDYVNGYRILQACKLLTETKIDANAIGRAVGYTNVSYFNRQFKRYTGVTPLVWRLTTHE